MIQKNYFFCLLGILTTMFAVAHCNESFIEEDYYYVDEQPIIQPNHNTCAPVVYADAGTIEFAGTLLYLKPNVDDSHYVLSSIENTFNDSVFPNGKRHQNPTSYSPGYRVEGLCDICPNSSALGIRFTSFNADAKDSVSGDTLFDTNGFPGFGAQASPIYEGTARSKNSYKYYAGDLTYNRNFKYLFPDNLTFIVGLHSAYIKFKEHTDSSGTFLNNDGVQPLENDLERNSQFWGIGPQIGLDFQFLLLRIFCLPGTWSCSAKARGALLCGNVKSDLRFVTLRTGPEGVAVHNGDVWRVIPSASADLGINYSLDCIFFVTAVEVGYTFMWYNKCVNKITGVDVAFAGDMIDDFNNLSLHGPYVRASLAF